MGEKKERYMKELIEDLESENRVIKSCESLDEYLKILEELNHNQLID